MFLQSFKMAIDSIMANKMRSFLTTLGIIIGVIALVVLVSIVNSASDSITEEVNAMGTDSLNVSIVDSKEQPLSMQEVLDMQNQGSISYTAAVTQTMSTVNSGGDMVTIWGVTPSYFAIEGLYPEEGRLLKTTDVENASYVAVFSYEAAEEIFDTHDVVGRKARIRGSEFEVIGVLEQSQSMMAGFLGSSIYIPYTTACRFIGRSESVASLVASASQDHTIEEAQRELENILTERFRGDAEAYTIFSTSMISDAIGSITTTLSMVLGGIAAISLLVGGIGIMNIMLVSVTERTREIGIRKAVGATTKDILIQFLIEALVLSLMGCLVGVLCSWGIISLTTWAAQNAGQDIVFTMSGSIVAAAIAFACVIGVIFGLYPARKAANMRPIDALRFSN